MEKLSTPFDSSLHADDIRHLLDVILEDYGYDFKQYAKASQERHLQAFLRKHRLANVDEVIECLHSDRSFLLNLVNELTTSTTELFRDPPFFYSFKENVFDYLKTFTSFKIWHAGCSTGEEVFSMAVLLYENGLLDRALLYGTDINPYSILKAKKGIVSTQSLQSGTKNYFKAGGKQSLRQYWTTDHDYSLFNPDLMKRIVFGEHNLVTDASFGEMQIICCKNVLIYFNRNLQSQVLSLFHSSLSDRGFLCLGSKETLMGSSVENEFEVIDRNSRIYRNRKYG